MGLKIGFSSSTCRNNPNPNKYNFEVKEVYLGTWAHVLLVNYPDCSTYNGDKVLVIKGDYVPNNSELDPHFLDGNNIVARFVPTEEGIAMAKDLINN